MSRQTSFSVPSGSTGRVAWGLALRGILLAVLLSILMGITAGSAAAEPLCTDTWTGGSEGAWETAGNWSAAHAPTSSDVACIGSGTTVRVTSGSYTAGVLSDAGTLVMKEATLEVSSALEASSVHALTMNYGAVLTGVATVDISGTLTWNEGLMSGSGSTVLQSGATAVLAVEGVGTARLAVRTFVNQGTVTMLGAPTGGARLGMYEGAKFENVGTLNENNEGIFGIYDESVGAAATFINTGTVQTTENKAQARIEVNFENKGTVAGKVGVIAFRNPSYTLTLANASVLEGEVLLGGPAVSAGNFTAPTGTVTIENSTMTIPTGVNVAIAHFVMKYEGNITGPGTLTVSQSFDWANESKMLGTGKTVFQPGSTSVIEMGGGIARIKERTVINEGTMTLGEASKLDEGNGARFKNLGIFKANSEEPSYTASIRQSESEPGEAISLFTNSGIFEKTATSLPGGLTVIQVSFINQGEVIRKVGELKFINASTGDPSNRWGCGSNPSTFNEEFALCGEVDTATGNLAESQTDFTIGGRGVGLGLTRFYNSQAAEAGIKGIFGYGWSSSFSDYIAQEILGPTVVQASGGTVPFTEHEGGSLTAPAWSQDTLTGSEATGYTLTLPNQTVYRFAGESGRLESVTDRNGNATTLTYSGSEKLESITDPAGRKIQLEYNEAGFVKKASDSMGFAVEYTYDGSGNLKSVTQPGALTLRWQFAYGTHHELKELTDGRGNTTKYAYGEAEGTYSKGKVTTVTDPLTRVTAYVYLPFETVITNETTKAKTQERFTSAGLASSITHGYETASATTETQTHDEANNVTGTTDGNLHTIKYGYDTHSNRTSSTDPEGHETKWTYNSTHDVETETKPNGETTTYKRDSHGNPEVIERPAPGATTQSTSYKYDTHGEVESMTDPLKHVWKYEYDTAGDKIAETDPEADKRTWAYNTDSYETSMVSPRGHVKAGEEAKYTTTTERDAQGRPIKVTDPLKQETTFAYDANGNLETKTDPELNKATYTYDADNERTKTKEPSGLVTETGYDGAGQVTSQTDGNKHTTKYERNVLEQVTEIVDPRARKTLKEYDKAGNLTTTTDSLSRTTTYKYNQENRHTEVSYSDGITPAVKYEYNANGDRTQMTDGTGTTTYEYDQLDRLTATKDGHGSTAGYEYDLANERTKITYPTGKAVTRTFDTVGRLKSITDWAEHATKFAYDADSDLKATTFPTGTSNEDTYAYDETDAMKEVKMKKGAETLASLVYARNKDGLVKGATSKGLPGEEKPAYTYDANKRLSKGATITYKYDEANNPTTIGSTTYKYDAASEPEKAEVAKVITATYGYNELGERTKTTPSSGAATTYGYDQAERLTSVSRPKSGETPAIEDTYGYNGDGLRTSQTISSVTSYLAWDTADTLPLVLNDGTNSYIYGPGGAPIEQVSSGGTALYLHHDQQGSTRMLTSATGTVAATTTYDAYGNKTGSTGASTTPLGYDGQYTDSDTGLIYLRARYYDPVTAGFLTIDPAFEGTLALYTYVIDNPLSLGDPSGLCATASAARYPSEGSSGPSAAYCKDLRGKILGKVRHIAKRLTDLEENKNALPPSRRANYAKTFNDKQIALEKELKKYHTSGCPDDLPHYVYVISAIRVEVVLTPGG